MWSFLRVFPWRRALMTKLVGSLLLVMTMVAALRAGEAPGSGVLTLERAYDLALATDQSIKIAYWEVRKANLLPWSALTRLGPQLSAGGTYSRRENSVTRPVQSVLTTGPGATLSETIVSTS